MLKIACRRLPWAKPVFLVYANAAKKMGVPTMKHVKTGSVTGNAGSAPTTTNVTVQTDNVCVATVQVASANKSAPSLTMVMACAPFHLPPNDFFTIIHLNLFI